MPLDQGRSFDRCSLLHLQKAARQIPLYCWVAHAGKRRADTLEGIVMRYRIYISGPITAGNQRRNYQQAVDAQIALMSQGYSTLNPMLTMQLPDSFSWQVWLDCCLPWVEVSDIVLRLPGYSRGADIECRHARNHGITVCSSIPEVIDPLTRHTLAAESIRDAKVSH